VAGDDSLAADAAADGSPAADPNEGAPGEDQVVEGARPEAEATPDGGHEEMAPSHRGPSRPGLSQRIKALVAEQGSPSRDESFHQAAMELRQFMEPARQQLVLNVPGSSSPEEAEARLNHQSAIELEKPVTVSPTSVIDLRNPPEMRAYPPAEKLSNRVLRLANRHWAREKPRPSADIVAEKSAIADLDFAQKPAGTQRCFALRGAVRCRGVFAFRADQQDDGAPVVCPTCGTSHRWDAEGQTWVVDDATAVAAGRRRAGAISSR
jgi:hypothetical protein